MDNFVKSPHSVTRVYQAMLDYFDVVDRDGMLDHFYSDFNKQNFAGFCKVLAGLALKEEDPMAQWVFAEAGRVLAHHIIAIQKDMSPALTRQVGGPRIICIGSVWKSWKLMSSSFKKGNLYKSRHLLLMAPLNVKSVSRDEYLLKFNFLLLRSNFKRLETKTIKSKK